MSFIPVLLAFLVGFLPLWLLLGRDNTGPLGAPQPGILLRVPLIASLAFPLGAGLIGLANFVMLAGGLEQPWFVYLVVAGLAGATSLLRARAPESLGEIAETGARPPESASFPGTWMLALTAAAAVAAVLFAIGGIVAESPHGAWDSWAIWSLRGKFFAGGVEFWRNAVDAGFRMSHPEYPVMLSSYLGWSWRIVGSDSVAVPQATAIAYLLSLVGIVSAGVARLRRGSLGLMAIPVLLSPVVMVTVPASLYADLPMGATSAAAAILLLLGIASSTSTRFFALAGVFASLCIWTKEEGLLHVAVFILAALAAAWLTRAESARWPFRAAPFLAATLPAGLLYAWLRLGVIPSGATRFAADGGAGGAGGGLFARALDLSRYGEVAGQLWSTLATLGGPLTHPFLFLLFAALLLGTQRHRWRSHVTLVAAAMLLLLWGGYLASFLLMGARPGPTLAASLHRLWLHTWPLLVVAFFLALRAPEDLAVAARTKPSRSERKQAKPMARKNRERKGDS